ncbi:hypothetical protein L2E82_34051 [Cichorium intybus]|uniref:Uncharacterized protein n=1 Tax=Cichorium intybus TaxID=13427 RepID=A0ACB9BLH3_CICIN|nr:hypothetical protein L2E82_34051 [Cichorium intybus]
MEEDDWDEGEINGDDEAHESRKVPEKDNHDKNLDGEDRDRIAEDGHVENSRINQDPNRIEVHSEANNEIPIRPPVQTGVPMGDKRQCHTLEVQSSNECDIHNNLYPDTLKDLNKNKEDGGVGDLDNPTHSPSPLDGIDLDFNRNMGNQAHSRKVVLSSCPGEGEIEAEYNQEDAEIDEDRSVHDRSVGSQPFIDFDGADSSQSFDLNSEPMERCDWFDIEEEVLRCGKSKKSKNKDKKSKRLENVKYCTFPITMKSKDVLKAKAYKKNKKADQSHTNHSSPNKSESSINISEEILKTKNLGSEVGFQMEGFDEMLRNEIEGEGVTRKQS